MVSPAAAAPLPHMTEINTAIKQITKVRQHLGTVAFGQCHLHILDHGGLDISEPYHSASKSGEA
jgi:hypothetical protein